MVLALYDLTLAEFTPLVLADFVDMVVQQDPVTGGSVVKKLDSQHLVYNGEVAGLGGEMYQDTAAVGHGRKFIYREDPQTTISLTTINERLGTNGSIAYNPRANR